MVICVNLHHSIRILYILFLVGKGIVELKLMVSSWQNEISHINYRQFQPNMESLVINSKLKLKTENWIWSVRSSPITGHIHTAHFIWPNSLKLTQNLWHYIKRAFIIKYLYLPPLQRSQNNHLELDADQSKFTECVVPEGDQSEITKTV